MKGLAAIIAGCMLLTGALVSCGEDDESSSSGKTAAATETSEAASETTSEAEAKTTTAAKTTSEAKTTEAETTSEKPTETEAPSENAQDGITGKWSNTYCITEEILTFDEDGIFSDVTDYTPYLNIQGSKATYVGLDADVTYEDGDLKVIVSGEVACEYRKFYDVGDKDYEGLYVEVDPAEKDLYFKPDCAYYSITEGKTEHIRDGRYTVSGNELSVTESAPEGELEVRTDYTFRFEGDKLILTEAENGDEIVCERAG